MNLENCQIYDISPLISPEIAVFPGDTLFEERFLMDISRGDNLTLSSITTTVHLGAHTDAPSHYHRDGETLEKRKLQAYLGRAQVIEVQCPRGARISVADLRGVEIQAPRVLFKTNSFPNPNQWNNDFVALSPELVKHLASQKVILIGIDTPSVDLSEDKELLSHHQIYEHNMAILEGIVLQEVSPGLYDLVALPLRIKGADASPVRAILLKS